MTAKEVEQRLRELSALKLHPRDQEAPRALLARAERVYTMTLGGLREQVDQMMAWYQHELAAQEAIRTAKASRRMEQFLDRVETYLGESGCQDPFFEQWPQEPEEDE